MQKGILSFFSISLIPQLPTLAAYNPLTSQLNPQQDVLDRDTNAKQIERAVLWGLRAPPVAYQGEIKSGKRHLDGLWLFFSCSFCIFRLVPTQCSAEHRFPRCLDAVAVHHMGKGEIYLFDAGSNFERWLVMKYG